MAGIDLEVRMGECFGLLGPNGAGKTTTVEIFEGLTIPDSGRVEVLGQGWGEGDDRSLRERLAVQLQETQFAERLTVVETIAMFRSLYRRGVGPGRGHPAGGAGGETGRPGGKAFGRPEATAGHRLCAGDGSRGALPG